MNSNVKIIIPLLIVLFGLIVSRIIYLQSYCREEFLDNSHRQQYSIVPQSPQRGVILDRRGRILAASNKIHSVFAEPRVISDVKETAMKLQDAINFPGHIICETIHESKNPGYVKLLEDISDDQIDRIRHARCFGIGIDSAWTRYYPMGRLTSHIVGVSGVNNNGLSGIEQIYNQDLSGDKGKDIFAVDASRKPIGLRNTVFLEDGRGLILTLDTTIQQIVYDCLNRQLEDYQAESAFGIVMDPWSGQILAMVSLPDYDPSDLSSANRDLMKNRAITDPFEPGSIFKPIVAAIALDNGIISKQEQFDCEDGYFAKYRIGEWGNHRFGDLNVKEILTESSNIGMAKIGMKIGQQRLYDGIKLFGFGSKSKIDLPGEDVGILYPPSHWSGYSITRLSYGYEISVTGIQIMRAFCALANGGRLVTPHLVRAIVNQDGSLKHLKYNYSHPGHIIKPEVANWIVKEALTNVVENGTGKKARLDEWQVFGKTGTAHIALSNRKGYDDVNYTASFVGGAPADHPRIVIMVSIRKPDKSLKKGYSGGRVAAPVVGRIIDRTMTYLESF